MDFLCLTHAHYDHFSVEDLLEIERLWSPHYFVPVGAERYLAEAPLRVPASRVTSLVWWEAAQYGRARITLTPAQHSSRRGPFDADASLHGGFTVDTGDSNVYIVGDSGYVPGLFEDIGKLLGPFDLAAIPIGAYAPRDMHAVSHMDPTDAMRVHQDARCRASLAVHWGTFRLTTEPLLEPREILEAEARALELRGHDEGGTGSPRSFRCIRPGEVIAP